MILFNAKSSKTGKVEESKTSNIMSVEVFSIDTTKRTVSGDFVSAKTGKVKESKTSKIMPVDVFSIGTTKRTVSGDVFSYGRDSFSYATLPETVVATGKTGKVAKSATDVDSVSESDASSDEASAKSGKIVAKSATDLDSENDASSNEASAKSGKTVAKVVRAMPIERPTGTVTNAAVAENAAVINGAGAFFVMLTFAAVGMMMA